MSAFLTFRNFLRNLVPWFPMFFELCSIFSLQDFGFSLKVTLFALASVLKVENDRLPLLTGILV